jgi:two-component system phosphate regulon sensor histidine kinase PhoR
MVFVGGIILIVAAAFGLSLLFRNLSVQFKLTKLYDNFIANITHELKSPLTSIQLYLETLKERNVPQEKQAEFIGYMMKDASRLKNQINSILELSALEKTKHVRGYFVYDAETIFKKLLKDSASQFKLPQDAIRFKGKIDCECVLDPKAIKIVFDNLIDNAIKYSLAETILNIEFKTQFNKIIIKLSDNGIGLPPNETKKIFNKFYRIYDKNIPNVKGSGLGLFMVKEILRYHGGKITASSNENNLGALFRIELPIYKYSKKRLTEKLLKITKKRKMEFENISE